MIIPPLNIKIMANNGNIEDDSNAELYKLGEVDPVDLSHADVSKEQIIAELRVYICNEFMLKCKGENNIDIKPNEYMAAIGHIIKLKGFDKIDKTSDMPDEIEIDLP